MPRRREGNKSTFVFFAGPAFFFCGMDGSFERSLYLVHERLLLVFSDVEAPDTPRACDPKRCCRNLELTLLAALPYQIALLAVALWTGVTADTTLSGLRLPQAHVLLLTLIAIGPVPLIAATPLSSRFSTLEPSA